MPNVLVLCAERFGSGAHPSKHDTEAVCWPCMYVLIRQQGPIFDRSDDCSQGDKPYSVFRTALFQLQAALSKLG